MKVLFFIVNVLLSLQVLQPSSAQNSAERTNSIDFFGATIRVPQAPNVPNYNSSLSDTAIRLYIQRIDTKALQPYVDALLDYKSTHHPDDWLYYQAVRKLAEYVSPKAENYHRYTFYKWWFLAHSGYDAKLTYSEKHLLFYVQSDEKIYNIPSRLQNGKQYVCLNYHDYGSVDFDKEKFQEVQLPLAGPLKPFSYRVTHLPDFNQQDYTEREIQFSYYENPYSFKLKLNPQVKTIFNNYPVVDYELQCNMPLSNPTYQSLIPSLRKAISKLNEKDGVDFLMHFTRYAFLFKPDREVFGAEKRMSPEQTLLHEYSDCEDRAGLFFYLVKEIYNRPMLVLTYPEHVTIAVNFKKAYGKTIEYSGLKYSICEPSPQRVNLQIGQSIPGLNNKAYAIAYAYAPVKSSNP